MGNSSSRKAPRPSPPPVPREALETQERQLREAQAVAGIGSWEWDLVTDAIAWSQELYRIRGMPPESFRPTFANVAALIHPEDRERVEREIADARAQRRPFETEYRTVLPDGGVRHLLSRGRVEVDGTGRPVRMIGTIQDITERKGVELALRASEERVRLVGQATNDWVWDWDVLADRWWWNEGPSRLFGYAPGAVPASFESWTVRLHPDDAGVARAFAAAVAGAGDSWTAEYRFRRADGSYAHVFDRAYIIRDATGRAVRVVGSALDITERRRAEDLLAGSKRVLEMLMSGAPLPEALGTLCRTIEALADGVRCSILLLDRDGLRLRHVAAPSLPDAYCRAIDGIVIGPAVGSCGTAAYRREAVIVSDVAQDPRWADYRHLALPHDLRACWSTPIFDSRHEVLGTFALYTGACRGPTPEEVRLIDRCVALAGLAIERERSEESLRENEERYRSLYEDSPLMYFTVDATGLVRSVNKAAVQQLGYARDELVGQSVLRVFHPDDRAAVREKLTACAAGDAVPGPWEFRKVRRDGRELWVREFPRPIVVGGERLVFIICEDITERRRAQVAVLRSRAQLRDLAARLQAIREEERTRIAREIHDQVGQALTALKIDLAYLEKRIPEAAPPQVAKKLKDMAAIVDDTVGTIHRIATELRPGILDDLGLPAAIQWLGREFGERTGIRVRTTVTPDDLSVRPEQATATFRILQESLTNVARHAGASEVQVTFRADAQVLELVVQDDGAGISEEQAADHSSLGLLGMSERAQACGGVLSIVGVPGRGTTLTLFMPLT